MKIIINFSYILNLIRKNTVKKKLKFDISNITIDEILNLFNEDTKNFLKKNDTYYYIIFNNLKILPYILNSKNTKTLIYTLLYKINYHVNNLHVLTLISPKTDTCSICLLYYNKNDIIFLTKCNHEFHISCISLWLKDNNKCPLCRTKIKF